MFAESELKKELESNGFTVKVSKQTRENEVKAQPVVKGDTLDPEYWSVLQVQCSKLDPEKTRVAFAKAAEAREFCARLTSQCAQALLTTDKY